MKKVVNGRDNLKLLLRSELEGENVIRVFSGGGKDERRDLVKKKKDLRSTEEVWEKKFLHPWGPLGLLERKKNEEGGRKTVGTCRRWKKGLLAEEEWLKSSMSIDFFGERSLHVNE